VLKSRSALENYRAQPGVDGANGNRALRLGEVTDTRLVQVGIYPGGTTRVAAAVLPILGGPLPDSTVCAAVTVDHRIMRIASDQYWVVGGDSGLEKQLRSAIPTDAGCVTSLDAARTRLLLEGRAVRALLGRLAPIDLDPMVFPVNAFAQTGIHHVPVLILRSSEERYELFALRTFAASTWDVLLDAARLFGYETVLPEKIT